MWFDKENRLMVRNWTAFTLVWLLPAIVAGQRPDDVVLADFESGSYGDWQPSGAAFGDSPARGTLPNQQQVEGFAGEGLVNSYRGGDASTGTLLSREFEVTRDFVAFLIGGGRQPDRAGIELLVGDTILRSATGSDSEGLVWRSWDVRELRGKQARIRIYDRASGGWGHINIDHILLTDKPRSGFDTTPLELYRQASSYYRELHRPQFHFSPEINWMNDPNGLVHFDGEYHLFYQYNPLGNSWGHMSWGHAVSKDLVHWEHLPLALAEENGIMIFSGCALVDWKNTSRLGRGDEPPLIAVYSGHGHDRQTQNLAYSHDRGRNWIKYADNPVLDIGERDFRDPKVFWHEPSQKWVMVVALAAQRKVQFYGSQDLKVWEFLSDFGPAGAKDKPNWECPDLFELPIEGEPGQTRWILEADMGDGAIAGGSGGEYFVGQFDGTRFRSDYPLDEIRWVDYGRDFYAPVSWSDIPQSDGRRIWIGWMNNWQSHMLPTHPWRGAQSVPRVLSLRRTTGGLRLVQRPTDELERLRGTHVRLEDLPLSEGDVDLAERNISGELIEIVAEWELGSATEFGLKVRQGGDEETIVGYDMAQQSLFVDRRESGLVGFDPVFPGKHSGPMPPQDGRIRLQILVDSSSIEVFGNDGHTVITDCIFPSPTSQGVSLYSRGGDMKLVSLDVWELKSIWHAAD
jgi:fructan beta-fructosidase